MSDIICGLLGEKLGHTFSPAIHSEFGDYQYNIYEKREDELDDFFARRDWDGINVTIPYKKTVMKYCDDLSPVARVIGSVNTIVRRPDGSLFGDNTDAYGFELLLRTINAQVTGCNAIVLGSGGASLTAVYVLRKLRAKSVTVISRSGPDNYDNLEKHYNANIIINTTPVGMYPNTDETPIDLRNFRELTAVVDVIYNPLRTNLIMQAESLGVPCIGGIRMLVGQAARSAEQFTGIRVSEKMVHHIAIKLMKEKMNLILVGMPGSGKTRIARSIAQELGRPLIDTDEEVIKKTGRTPASIITEDGEAAFRAIETEVIKEVCNATSSIISTGGGCVTRDENYAPLHRNGLVVWIKREISYLPTEGRPLSATASLSHMYMTRKPMYERFCDVSIENNGSVEGAVREVLGIVGK